MERFAGQLFHSADWNHDIDLRGKRVSVIGTGSSAAQMLPALESAAYTSVIRTGKDVVQKLMPSHPIRSKRIVFDNGVCPTLTLNNVHLVTEPIDSVGSGGIKTRSHATIETDVIVCAAGFKASDFLLPIHVRGRDGHSLDADWARGAQAFMGLAVYRFPNLFMIAGPNAFNSAGSHPDMNELQVAYILKCLCWKERIGARAIEVRREAAEGYQAWLEEKLDRTVWSEQASSWYRHESGQVTSSWPASRRECLRGCCTTSPNAFSVARDCAHLDPVLQIQARPHLFSPSFFSLLALVLRNLAVVKT
ncbi:hypothetical protein N0V95_009692 [Ascochyta clinopodiicola]|nr:hypothetical protein N0V95_009692 [Ascochyta clinopodiicola]